MLGCGVQAVESYGETKPGLIFLDFVMKYWTDGHLCCDSNNPHAVGWC